MFEKGDGFIKYVKEIELIRKQLSPDTKSFLKELGVIAPGDNTLNAAPLPDVFWSAKAAYAHGNHISHACVLMLSAMANMFVPAGTGRISSPIWRRCRLT